MRDNIEKWKPKLSEGKCYYMRNFKVVDYDASFKMCKQKFMLAFLPIATKVEEIDNPGIPLSKFNFKDLSEIQAGKYVPDLLVGKIPYTFLYLYILKFIKHIIHSILKWYCICYWNHSVCR
jgi:hypothetical protein